MKLLKRCITILLVFAMLISVTACNVRFVDEKSEIDGPHFSERTYERLDDVAAYALLDEVEELCAEDGNLEAVIETRELVFSEYYNKLSTYYTVASIHYDLDVTDEYWKTESEWISNFYNEYHTAVLEMEKVIFSSQYAETFIEELGQDYADFILSAVVETEEQLAMQARMTELESDYQQKYQLGTATAQTFANILTELVNVRNAYARTKTNAEGEYYANYLDYAYAEIYGREYTPEQAKSYRAAVKYFLKEIAQKSLSSYSIYQEDTAFGETEIKKIMPKVIENTVPEMMETWNYMMERDLYDFKDSNTKANTSYVTGFSEYGDAYMFINPGNSFCSDLSTLIHEFGHYNEHFMHDPDLSVDGVSSYDLAETHSQALELLTLPAVKEICINDYSNIENLYESYAFNCITNGLFSILSACSIDNFEYEIYNADSEDLNLKFFNKKFSTALDYWPSNTGWEFYMIPHIFTAGGYYISYSVSMIFSTIIWASDDPINNYLEVVRYGSDNYLSTVATNVGLDYPMDQMSIARVADKYKSVLTNEFGVKF